MAIGLIMLLYSSKNFMSTAKKILFSLKTNYNSMFALLNKLAKTIAKIFVKFFRLRGYN